MAKNVIRALIAILACAVLLLPLAVRPQASPPKVLVLYDAPTGTSYDQLGLAYAIMLRNLLGHFNAQVEMRPVGSYTAGMINGYEATFYLGAAYDHPLPAAFLSDAATTTRKLVWFRYNIWQLAWNSSYDFQATRGIAFHGLRGLNAPPSAGNPSPGFFETVKFKGLDFVKYYAWNGATNVVHADPDLGVTSVADAAKAAVAVSVANVKTGEVAPYIVRSGNFWYVADMPFSYIGPRDRYLVVADLLHDMLAIPHAEDHRALVRLEDVGADVDFGNMKKLSDYLRSRHVPFSIALIPRYRDPLGHYNGGVPQEISLSQATDLKRALDYGLQHGAELVMHGFTHQYGNIRNTNTGVSGDDFEFWNMVDNRPVLEDSTSWVLGRLDAGLTDIVANGYKVVAWETPHYQASAISSRAFTQRFKKTYHRVVYYTADRPDFFAATARDFAVGQIFPYTVYADYYGQQVLPENLGNIEYDLSWLDPSANVVYTSQDIITNARYARTVRDGVASFFFHPFLLDPQLKVPAFSDFKATIEGISKLGFRWVPASRLP